MSGGGSSSPSAPGALLVDDGEIELNPGRATASVVVENTGDRLTAHLVSTLTEPFQRGTDRIRTDHAGVGLGLAIVASISEAHDGALTIVARPDGGLRVTVQLPAAPSSYEMGKSK